MPKAIEFNNPAFNGVQAQKGTMYIPDEGEVFALGGSNENINQLGSLGYVKGGKAYSLDLAKLAYEDLTNSGKSTANAFANTGAAWNRGRDILKSQGVNFDNVRIYNPSDVTSYGGDAFRNMGQGSVDELKSIFNPAQTGGNIGMQTNIQGVGAGAVNADAAKAAGFTGYDPNTVTPEKAAQLQAGDKAQQALAGTAPVANQATFQTQLAPSGETQAANPTLANTVEQQAMQNGKALANAAYINAVFKAYHGRDANAGELQRYATRSVADTLAEIKGGAPQGDSPEAQQLLKSGYERILNPQSLENLTQQAGFDPKQIVRVGNQLFKPATLDVDNGQGSNIDEINNTKSGIKLPNLTGSDLNNDALNGASNSYYDQYLSQIPKTFDEARNAYWASYLQNANFHTNTLNSLESKYQIDEKTKQLTDLDKQIAAKNQAWNTLMEDNRNQPISMAMIVGREAHIKRMASIEIEGLLGQREAIAGDIDRAEKRIESAYNAAVGDYADRVSVLKDFYNEQKEFFTKAEERAYQTTIKKAEMEFDLKKLQLTQVADMMKDAASKGVSADISLNDSFESAVTKYASAMSSADNGINKDLYTSDYKNWLLSGGEAGTGKTFEQYLSQGTSKPTDVQLQSVGYANRVQTSNNQLGVLLSDPKTLEALTKKTSVLGYIPDRLKDEKVLQVEQAERNFINAVLRRESGAVISPDEFTQAAKQYFPQPGDTAEVLKQKLLNRNQAFENLKISSGSASNQVTDNDPLGIFSRVGGDTKKIASAIGQFESGGNYKAQGPVVTSGMYKGERALGKYQIMPSNIPAWSKEALGYSITAKQFLEQPELQDAIAEYKMDKILKQYGNIGDVASVWFSGRPVNKAGNSKDVLGTSVPQYVKNVISIYNKLG